jgi:hypothetical protein
MGAITSVLVGYFAYLRWIRLPLPVLIFLAHGHRAKISLVLCALCLVLDFIGPRASALLGPPDLSW